MIDLQSLLLFGLQQMKTVSGTTLMSVSNFLEFFYYCQMEQSYFSITGEIMEGEVIAQKETGWCAIIWKFTCMKIHRKITKHIFKYRGVGGFE